MNDDFETRLKTLLNEQVDHETGPRRAAPPFEPVRAPRRSLVRRSRARRTAPWVLPLIAAACVAGVVLGGVGVSHLVSDKPVAPATHAPGPLPDRAPPPTVGTDRGTTRLDGADIAVPAGWQVTVQAGFDSSIRQWCLHPASVRTDDCWLVLNHVTTYHPAAGDQAESLMPSTLGVSGDPSLSISCHGAEPPTQASYRYATFGGRQALRGEFVRPCDGKQLAHYVQYVVTSAPMWFVVLGARSGPLPTGGLAALSTVVGRSRLPAQDGPLPVVSVAEVTASTRVSSGVARVTLREIVESDESNAIVLTGRTYTCDLPLSGAQKSPPRVGARLFVQSDGHHVTSWLVQ